MKNNNKGFSLVELIVVIAIMAILAAVAVVGVSVYIPKAQQANDKQLASDIEYALNLAMQSDGLTAGDYVVIKLNGDAVYSNVNGSDGKTVNQAMIDAFGDNWQKELNLVYEKWDLGVVANGEMMEYVTNSSFNGAGMNTMLNQVQSVVNAAGGYFDSDFTPSDELAEYFEKTGVELDADGKVPAGAGQAAANSTVFFVANSISSINTNDSYYDAWFMAACTGDATLLVQLMGGDVISGHSAAYAAVLGAATYVDNQTANTPEPTNFVSQLEMGADDRDLAALKTKLSTVANAINQQTAIARGYYALDDDNHPNYDTAPMKTDAMAFIAYMGGVESAADSMLENNNIYSDNYFNNGEVLNYVQNYVNAGTVLNQLGLTEDAFVFIYDGTQIVCVPLDY